jgi:hypothetical protein
MLCIFALPFLVAFEGWYTELGDVKTCLYAYNESNSTQLGMKLVNHSP